MFDEAVAMAQLAEEAHVCRFGIPLSPLFAESQAHRAAI